MNCNGFHTANNHSKCDYFKQKIEPFIKRKTTVRNAAENNKSSTNKNEVIGSSGTTPNQSYADQVKNYNNINKTKMVSKPNDSDNVTSINTDSNSSLEKMFGILAKMLENQDRMLNHLLNKEKA